MSKNNKDKKTCDFCEKPCENPWCVTKEKEKKDNDGDNTTAS